jgi:predicted porin
MKHNLMAAAAVLAILTANGAARADSADIQALKAQSAALKKQNAALEARLQQLEKRQAVQATQASGGQPAPTSFLGADLSGIKGPAGCALPALDGPLTFCGITVFGTIDAGLNYASMGLPLNNKYYNGDQLINKNARGAQFGLLPNGLSNTELGVKGSQEIWNGWSGVFMASTYINPQSGQLQNAPGSLVENNGLNRNVVSINGDGSRGGQAFNNQLYVGVSNKEYGQLTFGRHTSLSNDLVGAYDPAKSNAFSPIGYSGGYAAALGQGALTRWDNSLKYRVEYPVSQGLGARFGLMYKFIDGNGGSNVGTSYSGTVTNTYPAGYPQYFASHNDAGQISLGGSYGGLDVDGALGYYHQAVNSSSLTAAQLAGTSTFTSSQFTASHGNQTTTTLLNANANTLAGTVADTTGGVIGAKYTWNQFKLYAGWAHTIFHNPADQIGIGAESAQGGYILSSVNNGSYPHARLQDTFWTGVKYAYDPKTEFVVAYYLVNQNGYGWAANTTGVSNTASTSLATCSLPAYINNVNGATVNGTKYAYQASPRSSTCSGQLNVVSGYVDYHFNKRFDVYAGLMYSVVTGGLASGYINPNNWSPSIGARFTF